MGFSQMNRPFNKTKRLWEFFFQFGKREKSEQELHPMVKVFSHAFEQIMR